MRVGALEPHEARSYPFDQARDIQGKAAPNLWMTGLWGWYSQELVHRKGWLILRSFIPRRLGCPKVWNIPVLGALVCAAQFGAER